MTCPQCSAIEEVFDRENAEKELKAYRKKGPQKVEKILIDALKDAGVDGRSLIDIGGGIGAVPMELLEAGVLSVTSVEASSSYIAASKAEFERKGLLGKARYLYGDFVGLASQVGEADIVTLVRSICCYPDYTALVALSSDRARGLYGLVYPRDTWWVRAAFRVFQPIYTLFSRNSFQFFVHSTDGVEAILQDRGFDRRFFRTSGIWQVAVYGR
ncbi:MAG TPA: methyltransferase domain-containing protein [Anaerolineales bacterium]|nr:methyltransferase domain-containing protein [Anaerolineales bacterium]